MKKAFLVFSLLFFVNAISFAQESGNRIYGNNSYYQQSRRQPQTNTGSLIAQNSNFYSVEASVLMNIKPDAFVAVFGINEEAKTSSASNDEVNQKVADFTKALSSLGVTKSDIFVDFITQNRIYDYTAQGGKAIETLTGFETKKTIAIRYKSRDLFEKLLETAAQFSIFDLIKVDYVVTDFDAVRARLFDEAVKVIKAKEEKYTNSLGVKLSPIGLSSEKYDAFYPAESYLKYQAYESGDAYSYNRDSSTKVTQRKSFTFFYEPLGADKFDKTVNQIGIEPIVQYTVYLRMDYDAGRYKER
jgi:uncharacterized protein YggE